MDNVYRLVVPARDETRNPPAEAARRTGDVLILPCIRYERMEGQDGRKGTSAAFVHDTLRQDLTA